MKTYSTATRRTRAVVAFAFLVLLAPSASAQFSYQSLVPPVEDNWKYAYLSTYGTGEFVFDSEGAAVADMVAQPQVNPPTTCTAPSTSPNGPWTNQAFNYGIVTQQYRQMYMWVDYPASCVESDIGPLLRRRRNAWCMVGTWDSSTQMCWVNSTTFQECRDNDPVCTVGKGGTNPIHGRSGRKVQTETDYTSPTSPLLRFERFYTSYPYAESTNVGPQWRHTYSTTLRIITTGATTTIRGVWAVRWNGDHVVFVPNGSGAYETDPGISMSLVPVVSGSAITGWRLTTGKDDVEVYDSEGRLLSIEDRLGTALTLSYSTNPNYATTDALSEVTDRFGRKLKFTHCRYNIATGACITPPSSPSSPERLVQVELPDGHRICYAYNTSGYLATVTRSSASSPNACVASPSRQYVYGEGTYGTASRLTGLIDERGNRYASWRYDSAGRANLSVHGTDTSYVDRVELTYVTTNQIQSKQYLSATSFQTRTINYTINNSIARFASMSASCTSCGITAKSITYDTSGNRDLVTDFADTVTDYDYNSRSLETKRIEAKSQGPNSNLPEKRTIETDWHATFRVPTERRVFNAAGTAETKTRYAYNSRGQVGARCEIDPAISAANAYVCSTTGTPPTGVRRTVSTYCETSDAPACPIVGLLKTVDGPRTDVTDVTTYTYYATTDNTGCAATTGECHHQGDLWKVTNALGHVTETLRYDLGGRQSRIMDPNGVVTDLEYTARGWISRKLVRGTNDTTETDDAITAFEYDGVGQVTKVTQPDGAWIAYTYDSAHRLTGIADNAGNTITYTLDGLGNRLQEDTKDPSAVLKRTLSRVYNTLGQMTALKNAAGTTIATHTYDASSNIDTVLDAESRLTNNDHDPLNRLKQTIQDVGGVAATTAYVYDARDNLRQVTDPKLLNTLYTYDGLNDLTQLSSPDTGITGYTYDSAGNRVSQTDARGVTTTYAYDALNRLTAISYPTTNLNVTFAYDTVGSHCTTGNTFSIGRLRSITDHSGSTTYCYDRRGNVTSKRQVTTAPTGTGARTFTTSYTYTMADRLASVSYPDSFTATYTRNALGQITAVQYGAQGIVTAATYLPFGPLASLTYASGQTLTRSYDANYWPTGVQSSVLAQHYALDQLGNIEAFGVTAGVPVVAESYVYDGLDRLKEVRAANNALIEAFAYDATGNRTSKTRSGSTQAYGYPANNHRLTSIGSTARGYDANGNWTTLGGVTQHQYDDRSRLVSSANLAFDYNGLGQRVGVNDRVFGYDESGRLLFEHGEDFWNCVSMQQCPPFCEEFSAQGPGEASLLEEPPVCPDGFEAQLVLGAEREFVWLDDVPVGYVDAGTVYFVHADHLNTPRVVTTTTGTAVWSWAFLGNPFGENAANEDPDGDLAALAYPLRFPGQYDDGAGLFYNYFRDYEPAAGRFIESDPAGLRDGVGTYDHVDSRPLNFVDPNGLVKFGSSCTNQQRGRILQAATNVGNGTESSCGGGGGSNCGCIWCPLLPAIGSQFFTRDVTVNCGRAGGDCASMVPPGVTGDPLRKQTLPVEITLPNRSIGDDLPACGCLERVIFHELIHLLIDRGDDEDYAQDQGEKCFPCPSHNK